MAEVQVKVPEMGDAVLSATISMWHFTVGDSIKKDDDLVEMVTDKATFNMPSPAAGRIKELVVNEGDAVKSGDVIAVIEG